MARLAKIYFQDQLAGFLGQGNKGYFVYYVKAYLNNPNSNAFRLTLPISENQYYNKVLFPFFDGLIPEGWLLEIDGKHSKLNPVTILNY